MIHFIAFLHLHKLVFRRLEQLVLLFIAVPGLLFGLQAIQTNLLPVSFEEPRAFAPEAKPPRTPPKTPAQIQAEQLEALVADYTGSEQADFYIYIKNLTTGVSAVHNHTVSVPSGSIYKLFVAHEAYRLNAASQFDFYQAAGSTGSSVGQCAVLMVRNSSNACGEAVRAMLGTAQLNKGLHAQGYKGVNFTGHEAAHVSPYDIGLLYERLLNGSTLADVHRAEFIQSLKDQEWTFRIPTGLPHASIPRGQLDWGSKTGDVYGYANDSAIVWGENATYIIVIMSNNWPEIFPYSSYSIRHFSGLVYNLLNGTDYPLPY